MKHLYPEIALDETKFAILPSMYRGGEGGREARGERVMFICVLGNYWLPEENRRMFFLNFAKSRGFDPLVAKNWYPFTNNDIHEAKVFISLHLISPFSSLV